MYPDKAELFDKNDLHIHVPDGAVPKDGPSAGITLTTALSSLVTGQTVSPQLAMTGEVSLRGVVSPIGGLPEKLMAAKRAGVHKVFIPEENKDDLSEVADEVKNSLTIIPVSTVRDVLARKVDVLAFDRPALMVFAKESGGKLAVSPLETREHYGIAVSKERPDCLKAVNAVIRERRTK